MKQDGVIHANQKTREETENEVQQKKKKQQNKERRGFRWMIPSRRLEHIFGSGYVLKSFVREGARSNGTWNPIFRAGMHEAKNTALNAVDKRDFK